jgi:hypothetical protein
MILTMASAYVIAAYLVGSKLTRTQLVLINLVFIPAMLLFSYLFWGFVLDGVTGRGLASRMVPDLAAMPESWEQPFAALAGLVSLGSLAICLKFMRDVRRQP